MLLCLLSCSLAFFVDGVCSLSCSFSFSVGRWGSIGGARSVYRLGILPVVRSNLHFTSHHRSTTTSHPSVCLFVRRLLSTVWTRPGPRGCPTGQERTGHRVARLAVANIDPANTVTPGHGSSSKDTDRTKLFWVTVYFPCAQCNSKSNYRLPTELKARGVTNALRGVHLW
jgi:hypothetical protein